MLYLYQFYALQPEYLLLGIIFMGFILIAFTVDKNKNEGTYPDEKKSANQYFKDLKDEKNNRIIEADNKVKELEINYKKIYPNTIVKAWKEYDKNSDDYNINFSIEQNYKINKEDLLNYADTSINEGLFIGKNNNETNNYNGVLVHLNECLIIEGKNIYINSEVAKLYINILIENFKKLGKEYEIVEESYGNYINRETDYNWTLHPKSEIINKVSRSITQIVKDKVWKRDEGKCVQCGSREKLEFDHIIPHSKGGANTYRNIQLLCEKCNRSKSDKIG